MSLTQLFQRKLKLEMKLIHIIERKPKMIVKLDPIDPQDFIISLESIKQWSDDNLELYHAILENGMAEHICNREFLYEFYRHLAFNSQSLTHIDEFTLRFKNLTVLHLMQNHIQVIEHVPANCKELYLDFNEISEIKLKEQHQLELLSLSNNIVDDNKLHKIIQSFPQLRCINVSWNRISNLREFVNNLASLSKLKILIAYANPISMLAIYYTYITEHISLAYIDGNKYVKVEEVRKEEPKVQEKKEVKEEKKDTKKDNKKGAKVEEKVHEQPPKVELPKEVPKKELTREDFEQVQLNIKITNLQKFTGNAYDPSLFPAETDITKTQTSYWIRYYLFGEQTEQKQKSLSFDSATTQNDEIRLNFDISISKTFNVNYQNFTRFNQGIKIEIYQSQPKMLKDPETFELKPEIKDGLLSTNVTVLGATHIDLRRLHLSNKKEEKMKFFLFNAEAVKNPLFYDPYEEERQMVAQRKQNFENKLKKLEQERLKKQEEEQLLKQQKKGGKDQKKPPEKKPAAKKDSKQPAPAQKKKSQRCDFPVEQRQYCMIDQSNLSKGRQFLCIHIKLC